MPSDRKLRKFLRQWQRRYPFPFDWIDDAANKQCRRSEAEWLSQYAGATSLNRREVTALVEWRFAGSGERRQEAIEGLEGPALWGHARRCIKRALADPNATSALDHLLGECSGIPGWGPAMASAVLGVCRPERYAVADERALRALGGLKLYPSAVDGGFRRADWWLYLSRCRQLARDTGVSLRAVSQALWAAGAEAPALPRAPKRRRA